MTCLSITLILNFILLFSEYLQGLLKVFDRIIPGVVHRLCVRHLLDNFSNK